MARAKKIKYNVKHLDINLNSISSNQKQNYTPPEDKTLQELKTNQLCTPPFCDGMPKGNQNPSAKGGGGEDRRNYANSARKARISSSTSTKICP